MMRADYLLKRVLGRRVLGRYLSGQLVVEEFGATAVGTKAQL